MPLMYKKLNQTQCLNSYIYIDVYVYIYSIYIRYHSAYYMIYMIYVIFVFAIVLKLAKA